jgi:hypothetical protein
VKTNSKSGAAKRIQSPNAAVPPELVAGLKSAAADPKKLEPFAKVEGKQVYRLLADGQDAIHLWEKLRKVTDQTGFWPIVMRRCNPWGEMTLIPWRIGRKC